MNEIEKWILKNLGSYEYEINDVLEYFTEIGFSGTDEEKIEALKQNGLISSN